MFACRSPALPFSRIARHGKGSTCKRPIDDSNFPWHCDRGCPQRGRTPPVPALKKPNPPAWKASGRLGLATGHAMTPGHWAGGVVSVVRRGKVAISERAAKYTLAGVCWGPVRPGQSCPCRQSRLWTDLQPANQRRLVPERVLETGPRIAQLGRGPPVGGWDG